MEQVFSTMDASNEVTHKHALVSTLCQHRAALNKLIAAAWVRLIAGSRAVRRSLGNQDGMSALESLGQQG